MSSEVPSSLSPSPVFIFSRPFLIYAAPNYPWNRLVRITIKSSMKSLTSWNVCCFKTIHNKEQKIKKNWGIHKIDKFPKECHLLAFIMLLPGTVILLSFEKCMSWARSDLPIITFTCTSDYCFLNTLLLLVLRLWGYCYSESCANHSPWIESYSQVRLLIQDSMWVVFNV